MNDQEKLERLASAYGLALTPEAIERLRKLPRDYAGGYEKVTFTQLHRAVALAAQKAREKK